MKNPANIPPHVMAQIESDMARLAALQETRRHVVRHHGLSEWLWMATTETLSHGSSRRRVAAAIWHDREIIRRQGYDAALVCSIARDPDAFAHCDGGGALAEDFR